MGGETTCDPTTRGDPTGLSPRGRGNPSRQTWRTRKIRSIPAWAGKPHPAPRSPRPRRVYPRVGGETAAGPASGPASEGLSPRGRGNRPCTAGSMPSRRSIPAWAGKPISCRDELNHEKVYPRVGGETPAPQHRDAIDAGLSPRGRGNPSYIPGISIALRSIPAWAGKPARSGASASRPEVYPRVGGETRRRAWSSPTG